MSSHVTVLRGILSEGTVSFHAVFAKAFRSLPVGVFLSQSYFWQENRKFKSEKTHKEIDGKQFFTKTAKEWFDETGLSVEQQQKVRSILCTASVLEERLAGNPAKMFYHIDFEALVSVINRYLVDGFSASVDNRNKNGFKTQTRRGKKPKLIESVKNPNSYSIESLESLEREGERTPTPAPEIQNIQSQKKESEDVAPGLVLTAAEAEESISEIKRFGRLLDEKKKERETLEAEIPPSKKVAPKKDSPIDQLFENSEILRRGKLYAESEPGTNGRVLTDEEVQKAISEIKRLGRFIDEKQAKQTLDFDDAKNAEHQKIEMSGIDQARNPLKDLLAEQAAAQFQVTAIASPTNLPGVTLVEAAPPTTGPGQPEPPPKKKPTPSAPTPHEENNEVFTYFDRPEKIHAAWSKWITEKWGQHKCRFKTVESEKIALKHLWELSAGKSDIAEKIINQSIANTWKGLFALKIQNNGTKPTVAERRKEATANMLRHVAEFGLG